MVFGLMVVPLMMLLGMSVDLGRGISVRSQMQGALDAAVLAGGRAAQTASSNHDTVAQNAASQFFNAISLPHAVSKSLTTVASNATKTEFLWTATAWVPTPFMGIARLRGSENADTDAPAACKP
jgi:Flp pilus assembly protein TadG